MSSNSDENFVADDKQLIRARWEKRFDQVITPFEAFVKRETTGGLLLMATALIALVLANSALAPHYQHILHTPVSFAFGSWGLEKSLHHWINDALMTLFFFVIALELKRELVR